MTIEQKVENITGDLREYKQLVPGTFKHVDQLMKERQTDESLRSQWFYTADGELYFLKDKKPMLAITRESDNLVLRHIDDAFTQLTKIGNYLVDKTEAQASIESKNTVLIDLSKLRLSDGDSEYKCLVIDTKNYAKKLNSEEKRLAKRVYGSGKDLAANMKMLNDAGISETRIYVLNPEYIQKKAQNGPLGRASWLLSFNYYSYFDANIRDISISDRLRGVRSASEASVEAQVAPKAQDAKKLVHPALDDVLACLGDDVAPSVRPKVEERIRKLYNI